MKANRNRRRISLAVVLAVQVVVAAAFAGSFALVSRESRERVERAITGRPAYPAASLDEDRPLRVEPLYDDPQVVSDSKLGEVLERIRPKFPPARMNPNHVEHALRTWGVGATFEEPGVMSGVEMRDFLLDHGQFVESWGSAAPPLLQTEFKGVAVRWGREEGASVHHDHLLASLTEAGVPRSQPVFAPGRPPSTFDDILQQALLDVRLDEREVEWSAMAFALWLPPRTNWTTAEGRRMSFDLLARRLIRGHKQYGVCSGTHRVYSLVLLVRIDELLRATRDENGESSSEGSQTGGGLLSDDVLADVYDHLFSVRDLISVSQTDAGYWPSNWYDGAEAAAFPRQEDNYERVIATGHHLEWLAIAPDVFHPPREQIRRAAEWIIEDTLNQPEETLRDHYTFYSHVGSALALWRSTHPAEFWRRWRKEHPYGAD